MDMVQVGCEMDKAKLKANYEKACNDYVAALLTLWECDSYYGYWIGKEVGGVYDYGYGTFTIGIDDIRYCVDNDVAKEQYYEFQEYLTKCSEYNLPMINLDSWIKGAPRYDFTKLDAAKKALDEAIENEKEKF